MQKLPVPCLAEPGVFIFCGRIAGQAADFRRDHYIASTHGTVTTMNTAMKINPKIAPSRQ